MYDYRKLRGKIAEQGYTFSGKNSIAKAIGMDPLSLSNRLQNKLEFKQDDIIALCDVLGIRAQDIPEYFFTLAV